MKTRAILILSLAAATAGGLASAQEAAPPTTPPAPGSFAPPAGPRPPELAPPPGGAPPAEQAGAPTPPTAPNRDRAPAIPQPMPPEPPRGPGNFENPIRPPSDRAPLAPAPLLNTRSQPFLGVITSPLPPALSAQLGLAEGFGLLVGEVLPGSPAAVAGIQRHDVLRLFNDQQLVEPNQLATLIRALGKDQEATITLLRKGQEQRVTAKIGERPVPERRPLGDVLRPVKPGDPFDPQRFGEKLQRWGESARQQAERMGNRAREEAEKMREQAERAARDARMHAEHLGKGVREQVDQLRQRTERERREIEKRVQDELREIDRPPAAAVPPQDILTEAKPGAGAQIKVYSENSVTSWDGGKARLIVKDEEGEIEVATVNGKRMLTAKNPEGATVFSGPVDTEEQRAAVPEQFRKKLDQLNIRQKIEPPPAPGAPRGAQTEERVPLLHQLPIIGPLFSKSSDLLPELPNPEPAEPSEDIADGVQ